MLYVIRKFTLNWRHNRRNGVSNHQPHDCVLKTFFQAHIKENINAPRHRSLVMVNWPHKWPVTQKRFPFDDVIMKCIYIMHWMIHENVTLRVPSFVQFDKSAKGSHLAISNRTLLFRTCEHNNCSFIWRPREKKTWLHSLGVKLMSSDMHRKPVHWWSDRNILPWKSLARFAIWINDTHSNKS